VVKLDHPADLITSPGSTVRLSAQGTSDPDGDQLTFRWWFYREASSFQGPVDIDNADALDTAFTVPEEINNEATIHVVCEVKDNGAPPLTRYRRIIIQVKP
jgi:hypothetical protein